MTDTAVNNRLLSREAWREARERMPPILRALSFLRVEVINRIPYLHVAPWFCWVALWRSRVIQDKRCGFFRPEAVEFQVLQALQFRVHLLHPTAEDRDVLDQLRGWMTRRYPGNPTAPIHVLLRRQHPSMNEAEVLKELARLLSKFREWTMMAY